MEVFRKLVWASTVLLFTAAQIIDKQSVYPHSLTAEKYRDSGKSVTWSQMFYASSQPQPSYSPIPTSSSEDSGAKIEL